MRPDRHRQCRDADDGEVSRRHASGRWAGAPRASPRDRARRRRRPVHGGPAARRERAVPDRHGDQDALRGPWLMSLAVRTYLEMTDPSALDGAPPPATGVAVERVDNAPPDLWRRLYTE